MSCWISSFALGSEKYWGMPGSSEQVNTCMSEREKMGTLKVCRWKYGRKLMANKKENENSYGSGGSKTFYGTNKNTDSEKTAGTRGGK
jgi:hypothetical protein